jgi:hypothetical protein
MCHCTMSKHNRGMTGTGDSDQVVIFQQTSTYRLLSPQNKNTTWLV